MPVGRCKSRAVLGAASSLLLWVVSSCAPKPPATADAVRGEHVRVRLCADTEVLIPGRTHHLALLFETDPGWYLYAPLRNDSGLPILVVPDVPEPFRVDAALWPAPSRHVSEGGLLDHVYDHGVAVLLPLRVPADARSGQTVTFRCRTEWLVCGTGCIPGEGEVEIRLPVGRSGDTARASAEIERIRAAMRRLPLPPDALPPEFEQQWGDGSWSVRAPGALAMAFYPAEACLPLEDPISETASATDRLNLTLRADAPPGGRVAGILEIDRGKEPVFLTIDAVRPATSSVTASNQ